MSLSVSIRRTAAATAVLGLAALGLVGGLAPALAGSDAPRSLVGGSGPDPAFKRVGEVTRTARTASTTTSAARSGTTAGSTSYSFSTVLDGSPVRWDPCTPIRWTSNTSRGPAGGLDVLKSAVARVASLTGTTWEYVGSTTTVPRAGYLPTRAQQSYPPVLIGWTDAASSDLLAGQTASVLGMTRTAWFGVQMPDGGKIAATRAAVIALDRTDALPLTGATSWKTVALHEIAHAVGLGHVSDKTQLMATVLPAVTDLQAGDQAGLQLLGRSSGCVTVPGA
ncbi:MAG: matrixin family metalloprotease [Frankiales bacterium]|nr:MAG: matrixin family metalloprotease [Frankiales bacterium]